MIDSSRFTARLFLSCLKAFFSWGIKKVQLVSGISCDSRKMCKSLFILCGVVKILEDDFFLHFQKGYFTGHRPD